MAIRTQDIDYEHDGIALRGRIAWDDALPGRRPAVLVSHAWAGRGPLENAKAAALAELGYVGFALDLYGAGVLGSGPEQNAGLMAPFMRDRDLLQRRLTCALDTLRAQEQVDATRVAAIGFCFGGLCVLDLARIGSDLRGVVSFHGLLAAPGNTAAKIPAKILVLHGWDDPMCPPDQVLALARELTAAGADWQLHAYGNTMHAFTNPQANDPDAGTVYMPVADARSWRTMRDFLTEAFS